MDPSQTEGTLQQQKEKPKAYFKSACLSEAVPELIAAVRSSQTEEMPDSKSPLQA